MKSKFEFFKSGYLWVSLVFFGLALTFYFDIWGGIRGIIKNESTKPEFFSKLPLRVPKKEATLLKDGVSYHCNDCHSVIEPSKIQKSFFSAHPQVVLQHGVNDSCFNCHSAESRESLLDSNGDLIPFSKSELTCQKCHGTQYKDWQGGAHGRRNGYWNPSMGEKVLVTCVACHDPHSPKFKPMQSAPAPHTIAFEDQKKSGEETHE